MLVMNNFMFNVNRGPNFFKTSTTVSIARVTPAQKPLGEISNICLFSFIFIVLYYFTYRSKLMNFEAIIEKYTVSILDHKIKTLIAILLLVLVATCWS